MTVESDRRKLRQVYQQTKSRKRAVADARDGKKGGNSRQNNNNNNNNNSRRNNNNDRNNNDRNNNNRRNDRNEGSAPRRFIVSERVTRQHGFGKGGRQVVQSRARREEGSRRRFADKNVAKSGARARFSRAADSRQNNNNNNNGKKGKKADNNQPRFKRAAQTKQAKVQIRKNQQQQQKQKKDGKKKQDKPKQDKPKEAKQAPLSLDQLDAQLAAYKN